MIVSFAGAGIGRESAIDGKWERGGGEGGNLDLFKRGRSHGHCRVRNSSREAFCLLDLYGLERLERRKVGQGTIRRRGGWGAIPVMVDPDGGRSYPNLTYSGTQPSSMLNTDSLMAASTTCAA